LEDAHNASMTTNAMGQCSRAAGVAPRYGSEAKLLLIILLCRDAVTSTTWIRNTNPGISSEPARA